MAVTYPRELLDSEVKSRAEKRVFDTLHEALDDSWEVFHSASLLVRDPAEGARDDEVDLVLCHPRRGIVCLEVKGGGIECRHGEWFRLGRGGERQRVPDPFTQALDHMHNLRRKLESAAGPRAGTPFIAHAVAFPDITIHELVLAPDAPREILLDRDDLRDAAVAIERVLGFHGGARDKRKPLGPEGAALLRQLLAPQVQIRVPMATKFLEEEEALVTLTHEQSMALARMKRNRRMAIYGCAGSGKTMLAVEHAKRLARQRNRVLFVCFNRALKEHLSERERGSGVDFYTFHGLCWHMAKRAGVELPDYGSPEPPREYWSEVLPNALVEAVERLGEQYDAILVDEAQDLHNDWLTALMCTLVDEKRGAVWLFLDDNQRIYDTELEVPGEFLRYDLTVNCRNTQKIHHEVMKLYEGEIEPEVKGPPGRDVELFRSADQAETVTRVVQQLCKQEDVPPQDIVVLSAHGWDNSTVAREAGNGFRLVDRGGQLGDRVHFSSIRAFKGLESPVVVLCELEDLDDMTQDHQLYVGISRAKNHCVIVAPAPVGGN